MYWVTASELHSSGENAKEINLHGFRSYLTINAASEHVTKCEDLLTVVENMDKLSSHSISK